MSLVEDVRHRQGWTMACLINAVDGANVARKIQCAGGGTKAGALSYTRPYPNTELRKNRTEAGALGGRAEALGGGAEAPGGRTRVLGGRTRSLGGRTLALGGRTQTNAMGGLWCDGSDRSMNHPRGQCPTRVVREHS